MKRIRGKTLFWLFSLLLCLPMIGLSLMTLGSLRDFQQLPRDHRIGNRATNVEALQEKGFPFSFLVIGDTHGSQRGEDLIKRALKSGQYAFMIHLGDVVLNPDRWEHLFFLTEMTTEVKPPFPVFVVPGNHDIDYASVKINDETRRTTREVYDSFYGARRFQFTHSDCLFILTEIDPQNPSDYLNYLKEVLAARREGVKRVFVFTHYPPRLGFIDDNSDVFPDEDAFYSLLEKYRVTACFFGHYHGHWRGQRNGVHYIVAGGGGRHKERQSDWGKFHHILKVTVGEGSFSEEMITLSDSFNIEDRIERVAFVFLLPAIQNRGWILYSAAAVVFAWGILSAVFSFKSLRKDKS